MNLKEAFRYQNKLQKLMDEAQGMADLRNSEQLVPHSGTGYRFNTDGNQVAYKCDVKHVTTINFDRNVIRKYLSDMNKKADTVSAELDRCLVNAIVEFEPPFNVNDSFADVFSAYTAELK